MSMWTKVLDETYLEGDELMGDAAGRVHDTMRLAWLLAQTLFDAQASPETAVAIYDRMVAEQKVLAREREANDAG